MTKTALGKILPIAATLLACGCSTVPLTTTEQPMALDFALKRGAV
jgi:hypothetical protein